MLHILSRFALLDTLYLINLVFGIFAIFPHALFSILMWKIKNQPSIYCVILESTLLYTGIRIVTFIITIIFNIIKITIWVPNPVVTFRMCAGKMVVRRQSVSSHWYYVEELIRYANSIHSLFLGWNPLDFSLDFTMWNTEIENSRRRDLFLFTFWKMMESSFVVVFAASDAWPCLTNWFWR